MEHPAARVVINARVLIGEYFDHLPMRRHRDGALETHRFEFLLAFVAAAVEAFAEEHPHLLSPADAAYVIDLEPLA